MTRPTPRESFLMDAPEGVAGDAPRSTSAPTVGSVVSSAPGSTEEIVRQLEEWRREAPVLYVVSVVESGIDGRGPERVVGDDLGPFPTKELAVQVQRALTEAAAGKPYAPSYRVREVTRRVNRWE